MPRILRTDPSDDPRKSHAGGQFFVEGVRYTNSASKFWYGLMDEITEDFPECTCIELSSIASDRLSADLLFPEQTLEKDLKQFLDSDIEAEMKNTIAELEIIGAPSPVQIRLFSAEKDLLSRQLPDDVIDSEILSYMIVWPLKWADIPEVQWNSELLEGCISIEDRIKGLVYSASFNLAKKDLSEGLFRRSICLKHSVLHSGEENTTAP